MIAKVDYPSFVFRRVWLEHRESFAVGGLLSHEIRVLGQTLWQSMMLLSKPGPFSYLEPVFAQPLSRDPQATQNICYKVARSNFLLLWASRKSCIIFLHKAVFLLPVSGCTWAEPQCHQGISAFWTTQVVSLPWLHWTPERPCGWKW